LAANLTEIRILIIVDFCQRRHGACQTWLHVDLQHQCQATHFEKAIAYSGMTSPDPPISLGKSFSFGKPSLMRNTVDS
jgi:hypothetical protein